MTTTAGLNCLPSGPPCAAEESFNLFSRLRMASADPIVKREYQWRLGGAEITGMCLDDDCD